MVTCKRCGGILHAKIGNILSHDCRYPIRSLPKDDKAAAVNG